MADYRRRMAERIEKEMAAKSISRETLAVRAEVSEKTVKRLVQQKTENPRPVTIRRIAKALGIEPSELRPPPELEADQLKRIEEKLDRLLEAADLPIAPPLDGGEPTEQEAEEAEGESPGDAGEAEGESG